jgi:hypothetical protein
VLRSLAAPPPTLREDADALRERITAAVSGLLALLGIDADPIRSREHILLSTLLERAWRDGRDLAVATLIQEIQSPPLERVGVIDLESFFPAKDRFALAMDLNSLLASPGFAAWMEGDALDVGRLLHTPVGRPRLAILSIAHLSERERMFFVTLLLTELVAWMRTQPGTTSLRAVLYMDEVFGYLPPTANPPSKTPMLTLLKQARAYGLGVVLATQNPVDLDYKALSNAGTWFVGRLQTERDKARVLEGLEGASAAARQRFDRARLDQILSGLASRVFLMHDVHEDAPVLFQTRWTLSYLRGPLTTRHIQALTATHRATAPPDAPAAAPGPDDVVGTRPVLPPEVPEAFVEPGAPAAPGERLVYRPVLLATARLHYTSADAGIDHWQDLTVEAAVPEDGDVAWDAATVVEGDAPALVSAPAADVTFTRLPGAAAREASYRAWSKALADHLYRDRPLRLWRSPALDEASRPGEAEGEFRARLAHLARERRDAEVEKLRARWAPKLARLEERMRGAEARVAREESQYGHQKMQTVISLGATVLGGLFGRKLASVGSLGRATTAARAASRAARERGDVAEARENVEQLRAQLQELEAEFRAEVDGVAAAADPGALALEPLEVRARKQDVSVTRLVLAWVPHRRGAGGVLAPA